jgi:hypothetical protein
MVEIYLPRVKTYPEKILPTYYYTIPSYIEEYAPVPVEIPAIVRRRLREYAYAMDQIKKRYRKALRKHAQLLREARETYLPVPPKRVEKRREDRIKDSWRKVRRYLTSLYNKAKEGAKRIYALGSGIVKKSAEAVGKVVGTIKRKIGETWRWSIEKAKKSKEYIKNLAKRLRQEGREKEARMLEASGEMITEPAEIVAQEASKEAEKKEQELIEAKRMQWFIPLAMLGAGILILALLMKK